MARRCANGPKYDDEDGAGKLLGMAGWALGLPLREPFGIPLDEHSKVDRNNLQKSACSRDERGRRPLPLPLVACCLRRSAAAAVLPSPRPLPAPPSCPTPALPTSAARLPPTLCRQPLRSCTPCRSCALAVAGGGQKAAKPCRMLGRAMTDLVASASLQAPSCMIPRKLACGTTSLVVKIAGSASTIRLTSSGLQPLPAHQLSSHASLPPASA